MFCGRELCRPTTRDTHSETYAEVNPARLRQIPSNKKLIFSGLQPNGHTKGHASPVVSIISESSQYHPAVEPDPDLARPQVTVKMCVCLLLDKERGGSIETALVEVVQLLEIATTCICARLQSVPAQPVILCTTLPSESLTWP